MKSGTDAEKIVIYLTPLVLKTNLKIFIYEFDSNPCYIIKDFPCYIEDKSEILLLYRKTHYDLYYPSKYFEVHGKYLSSLVNLEENVKVLSSELIEKIKSNEKDFNDENLSNFINLNIKEFHENENNQKFRNLNLKDNHPSKVEYNESGLYKCEKCENDYIHKKNIFNYCKICVKNDLIENLMHVYINFSKAAVQLYLERKDSSIPIILENGKIKIKKIFSIK